MTIRSRAKITCAASLASKASSRTVEAADAVAQAMPILAKCWPTPWRRYRRPRASLGADTPTRIPTRTNLARCSMRCCAMPARRVSASASRMARAVGSTISTACAVCSIACPSCWRIPMPACFTEGEKDANRIAALGHCATTVASGSWKGVDVGALRDRDVFIVRDMDQAGARKAYNAAQTLHGVAKSIRIVELPGLDGSEHNEDVSDWLDKDPRNAEKFVDICFAAPLWEPATAPTPPTESTNTANKALRLSYFNECDKTVTKPWIMKGLFARGETSSWVAPPGAGKSALITAAAVYTTAGQDWRSFRCKERCGALYLAFERGDLARRRLAAYAKQGFSNLPIAIADQQIDLMHPSCIAIIVAAIREAEEHMKVPVGLIIIDTYAKGIAIGGGDEDKAKDQSRCLAHLRKVQEMTKAHIAIIGHTGKDETRGGRGSNAHQADVDVQVQISGDEAVKTAKVIKGNDQATGVLLQFTMRSEVMGTDEDGDEITVGVVSDEEVRTAPRSAWPKSLSQLLDAITTASIDSGFDHRIINGPMVRAVLLERVRAVYRRNYIVAPDSESRDEAVNKAFSRALKTARDARLIGGTYEGGKQVVWIAKEATTP